MKLIIAVLINCSMVYAEKDQFFEAFVSKDDIVLAQALGRTTIAPYHIAQLLAVSKKYALLFNYLGTVSVDALSIDQAKNLIALLNEQQDKNNNQNIAMIIVAITSHVAWVDSLFSPIELFMYNALTVQESIFEKLLKIKETHDFLETSFNPRYAQEFIFPFISREKRILLQKMPIGRRLKTENN